MENQPSTSAGSAFPTDGSNQSIVSGTGGEESREIRRPRRKKTFPSNTFVPPVVPFQITGTGGNVNCGGSTGFTQTCSTVCDPEEFSDHIMCPICVESMIEPTSTHCGHTYCHGCIINIIENSARCPLCGNAISRDEIFPNIALKNIMAQSKICNSNAIKAEVVESTSFTPLSKMGVTSDLVNYISNLNDKQLSLSEVDRLVKDLSRKREIMALQLEECNGKMLEEFLSQLLEIKNAQMDNLNTEVSLIKQDLEMVRTCFFLDDNIIGSGDGGSSSSGGSSSEGGTSSISFAQASTSQMDTCTTSSGIGFNTQPLLNVEFEHQSLSARKQRMCKYFDEMTQLYFNTKSVDNSNIRNSMATTSYETEERKVLETFGTCLSHITQFHGLKPLATFNYSAKLSTHSNIISSIEFDKDNEFFAIAGVETKIQLFKYITVIGYDGDIHLPSSELPSNAKVTCVSWNRYYKNRLACSEKDGCVSLWDVSTRTRLRSFTEHEKSVWSVDWSEGNHNWFASGSDDSTVKLWSTNQNNSIVNFKATSSVSCVKFCPVRTHMITFGCEDNNVYYYDIRSPSKPHGVLKGHEKGVRHLKFTSAGELISSSVDSTLKLWNLDESINNNVTFTGHFNDKSFMGLATDDKYIACGSENNSLFLYYKYLPKPLLSFKFVDYRNWIEKGAPKELPGYICAIAWKKGSQVLVAANSEGAVKILELKTT